MKTYIIEEHNEAFYVWNHALRKGLIRATNNTLLHVDEHADSAPPQLNISMHKLHDDMVQIRDFTYGELNIASFIVPALYQGIFNCIYWVRQPPKKSRYGRNDEGELRPATRRSYKRVVQSHLGQGKKLYFVPPNYVKKEHDDQTDRKYVDVRIRTVQQMPSMKDVVLDIDLDYFSTVDDPSLVDPLVINITKAEYTEYLSNLYHPIRHRFLDNRIEAVEKDGQYFYLVDGYEGQYPNDRRVDEGTILVRVKEFAEKLDEKSINPQIIGICRSKASGYTPYDQCEFIQDALIDNLNELYDLDITHISELP